MSWYVICVQHTCYSIVLAHATFTFMTILVSSWFNTNMSLTCLPSCHIQQIEDVARRLQDQGVVLMGYCNLDAYLGNVQQLETGNRWKCNKGKNKGSEGTHLRRAVTFLWIVCESTSSCLIPLYISLHEVIIGSYDLTVRHEPSYSCHIFCTCFLHVHWDLVTFSTAQQVSSCAAAFGRCPRPWAAFSMSKRSSLCSAWIIPKPVLYFNVLHKCCLHFPFRHVVNVSYYSYFRACILRHFGLFQVKRIAQRHGRSAAQVLLRHALQHGTATPNRRNGGMMDTEIQLTTETHLTTCLRLSWGIASCFWVLLSSRFRWWIVFC